MPANSQCKSGHTESEFFRDLAVFRAKYPMAHLVAWTPEDFDRAAGSYAFTDWHEPKHCATAKKLSLVEGTVDWDTVTKAVT